MKTFNTVIRIGMLALALLCFTSISAQSKRKVNRVRRNAPTTVKKQVPAKDKPTVSRSEVDAQMELMRLDEMQRESEMQEERIVPHFSIEAAPPPPPPPSKMESLPSYLDDKIFDVVENQQSFPGGMGELMSWLGENIHYPEVAEKNGIQGRVVVSFVIEKDGSITNVLVVRGVDPSLDKEAVRVTRAMPNWIPGTQNGELVRVKYNLPITFKLGDPEPKSE